jgi:DNA-binding Xre family transcriptional regulator
MNVGYVFESLRAHLRARGMTYVDLGAAIKLSESAVKKMFAKRDCSLRRLEQICSVLQVELAELARGTPHQTKLINELTRAQEQEIVENVPLFVVAVCTMQGLRFEDIVATYRITEPQCVQLLARLDKIGFLALLPNNRYRLLVAKTFCWIPDGPIMRWTKAHALEYFNHLFDGPGETLRVINVRLSARSRTALLARLEQLTIEYAEQHNADAALPIEQRFPLSLCLAIRPWEPTEFRALRRNRDRPQSAKRAGRHHTPRGRTVQLER